MAFTSSVSPARERRPRRSARTRIDILSLILIASSQETDGGPGWNATYAMRLDIMEPTSTAGVLAHNSAERDVVPGVER